MNMSDLYSNAKYIVAIDLGSNSFHIIIAREQDGCLQIMYRQKNPIALAAGLDAQQNLTPEAIKRAINCLRKFNLSLNHLPQSAIRIVATHALRKANNSAEFIEQAKQVLPYPIEVISGEQEAALIFQGVAHSQSLPEKTLIIDIGGGSTELVIGQHFSVDYAASLDMGCISFQQQFFHCGAITEEKIAAAQQHALAQLNTLAEQYKTIQWQKNIGTSGSIKTIAQVMFELYGDRKISTNRLKHLIKQLISWQHSDQIPLRTIEPKRRPLLAGAVAILSSCFQYLSIAEMTFSAGGVREGVLYQLSESRTDLDIRIRTIQSLIKLHHIDQTYSHRLLSQLSSFEKQLFNTPAQLTLHEKQLLHWTTQLHEIGIAINSKKRQLHGAYIIEHSNMPGFSELEQQAVTLLIANHRGKIKAAPDDSLVPQSNNRLNLLTQLFRLAILLTKGRLKQSPNINHIEYKNNQLIFTIAETDELMPMLEAEVAYQRDADLTLSIQTLRPDPLPF